jgi:carbon storage regulator
MALTLSRKKNESFSIGDNIRIVVSRIKGDAVRLSIDAPRELSIVRDDAKIKERVSAAIADGKLSELEAAMDAEENR